MVEPSGVTSLPTRRRRERLSAETVRQRMIRAGADIVREHGVLISLEEIAMDDVVRRAEVPRSSAYRIWPYKGDFVTDLLMEFAGPNWMGTAAFDEQTLRRRNLIDPIRPGDEQNGPRGRHHQIRHGDVRQRRQLILWPRAGTLHGPSP